MHRTTWINMHDDFDLKEKQIINNCIKLVFREAHAYN